MSECSTSPSAISGYVLNTREPDFDMLRKIAEYFHVSTDYLLEYENASVKSDDEVVRNIVKTMSPGQRSLWIKQGKQLQDFNIRAMEDAGAEAKIFVVRNLTAEEVSRSAEAFADEVRKSQMIFIPGGFSGGDEPDGSAKFITAFFRNQGISDAVTELLEKRDGLMCGICNGFQALIKLGLVPYGKIIETDAHCPTLTFNTIGRHQSRIVRTRVASTLSPWLRGTQVGDVYSVPISHGEGRFLAEDGLIRELEAKGQIATQYVDLEDQPSMDLRFNPNGSLYAIEGITSPDGRVFGKMGHSERTGKDLYKNVPGNYDIRMFESAVKYFK